MKAPRGLQEIKSPTTTTTSFTWKSGTLDMDSSDSFTLGFPLFLFFPPTQKPARNSSRNAFSTYMNSILIPRTKPLFFPLPLSLSFFFEREERGVFFFLHHYPGNLIHTEYNGEERGRLDRGLEEIMKFVHIQASWKVPPLSQLPPPFSSDCPAQLSHPPPPHPPRERSTRLIALWEAEWEVGGGGGGTLGDGLLPICVSQWKVEGTNDFNFQFGLWSHHHLPHYKRYLAGWQHTRVAIDKAPWRSNPRSHTVR